MNSSRRFWARAAALVSMFTLSISATSWAQPPSRPGEIIVKFKDSATPAERQAIEHDLGLSQIKKLGATKAQHGKLSGITVEQAIAKYKKHPKIAYIEPDYILRASLAPNDPSFSQLWGLQNTGQTGGTPGVDIRAVSAWSQFTGSPNVKVAIIDTGMDYNHPDLAANAWINAAEVPNNFFDDDNNGFVDDVRGWDFVNNDNNPIDDNGHGTHCAGTIGAVGNNGVGVVGVNWNVTLMAIKFLDSGGFGSTSAAVSSVQYATLMGVDVISASWGGGGFSQALMDAIDAAGQAGVLFVAAAGNGATNTDIFPNYPSAYPLDNIIAVAATDHNDQMAGFSNFGVVSVDLGAPGVDIYSTVPGGYGLLSGTSMATPHVAGAVALIMGRFPNIPIASAKSLLLNRVDPVASLNGRVLTGGRLNAFLPIAEPDSANPDPITSLGVQQVNGTWITVGWNATGDDGSTGTASGYQLRYSTVPLNEANFATGTLVTGMPAPLPVGSPQSKQVTGLTFSTQYHFAIKAYDEFGNPSPISNVPTATTLAPPDVSVNPSSLSADLLTDQQATRLLTITNTGPSELNFKIDVESIAGPGARPDATIVRSFVIPDRTDEGNETPPPGYTPATGPFLGGRTPGREPIGASDIRITNTFATGLSVLIVHSDSDVSEIRTLLAAFPDIELVDEVNERTTPVTLATLVPYDVVMVCNNFMFGDPVSLGNALADYVDQGGGVVMTVPSFIAGWEVRGRFLDQGYMPYNLGTGPIAGSTLGAFDAGHPIMAGVTNAFGDALGAVSLAPGAELVASWVNGQPMVATKEHVAAVNVFVGASGFWTGDIPLLLHNALFWTSGAATWASSNPREGVVPAGGALGVVVTFDATDLNGGDYAATLVVQSDDPDESSVPVALSLHVTGAPNLAIEGEQVTIESTKPWTTVGALTSHDLAITVPPPAGGRIEVVADGDYGTQGETATVAAEGVALGSVGQVGSDCVTAKGSFPLTAAVLSSLAADGVVQVQVQNSNIVDTFCPLNQHLVRLVYPLPTDQMAFGQLFVGGTRQKLLVLVNEGTDVLHITSIASSDPAFTVNHSSVVLPPDERDTLVVTFFPAVAQLYAGTLTITSDDPDQPVVAIAMSGEGLVPPDIDVTPTSLSADLLTGGSETQSVTVRNTGHSNLTFTVDISGIAAGVQMEPGPTTRPIDFTSAAVAAAGPGALDETGTLRSDAAPNGWHTVTSPLSTMAGSKVLIVQDTPPWGTAVNEQILNNMGVAFDMISSGALAGKNLSGYGLVIVPSDQPTSYYITLSSQRPKLESFVMTGGVLEVHAAGWGWQNGDASFMTIPGGMGISQYYSSNNTVLAPAHPLMVGIPNPFNGSSASHSFFTQIPPGATEVVADELGRTNLVVYSLGAGTVVAGCQTFEFGAIAGQAAGMILQNMIPFSYRPGPGWLSADPTSGQLAPGASVVISVRFDATGLNGGDYLGTVNIDSNDPDEPNVPVAASLHVTGAPDLLVTGARDSVVSTQVFTVPGATTQHHLLVGSVPAGDALLELDIDGDFGDVVEIAIVTVEGIQLGDVGRTGLDCTHGHGTFVIPAADFANIIADGVVDVQVRNSFDVDIFCPMNQHRVKLSYPRPLSPIDFGSLFVGLCATQELEVQNIGTDLLTISQIGVTGSGFSVTPSSLSLAPGERDTVKVTFCPPVAQSLQGTLTLTSNDPDQGVRTFALVGIGLVPPDIHVSPTAFNEQLNTGQVRMRTLTVENRGGSDLELSLDFRGPVVTVVTQTRPLSQPTGPVSTGRQASSATVAMASAVSDEPGPVRSDQAPEGFRVATTGPVTMADAQVLIVQDNAPWGSMANETILTQRGIAFDMRNSGQLAGLDLSQYRLIIISSDQSTGYYQTLGGQRPKLEQYVMGGGVLEVHAAGWGWQSGDAAFMTIPGGMVPELFYSGLNTILDPAHPIVAGVPNPFPGGSASHGHFRNIPGNAHLIAQDQAPIPDLVVYQLGAGLVVAGVQTFEYGYMNNEPSGLILQNMLAFSYRPTPPWFDVDPTTATVPANSVMTFTITLDATGLEGGDYTGNLEIESNDPDESLVLVPIALHVIGVPDLKVSGNEVAITSTQQYTTNGGVTTHDLVLPALGPTTARLQVDVNGDFGDVFEVAAVFIDGIPLGEVGRTGLDCTPGQGIFPLSAAQFAAIAADGVAHVFIRNTFDVDIFCAENRHTVTLRFGESIDPVDFGSLFVGNCATRSIFVRNAGTDVLNVTDVLGSPAEFSATPTSFTLAIGDTQEVVVRFCPSTPGTFPGQLTIQSNDPDGDFSVALRGTGLVPPEIALGLTSASEDLMTGQTSTQPFAIANHGGSDLTVSLALRIDAPGESLLTAARSDAPAATRRAPVSFDAAQVRRLYGEAAVANPVAQPVPVARAQVQPVTLVAPRGVAPSASLTAALNAVGGPVASIVPIFFDNFDGANQGWTHDATGPDSLDLWAISSNRKNSGNYSWRVMQHAIAGADVLISPVISLAGHNQVGLTFQHWYNFDDCTNTPDFESDGAIVQVREVGSPTWTQIHPAGGYPFVLDDICSNPLRFLPAYCHDSPSGADFASATFDLTPYAGKQIQVRFHAGWDCGNCESNEGWYVDDVLVFSNAPAWVAVTPTNAVIPPGDVAAFELKFDASELGPGRYHAELIVVSNDPDEDSLSVPVTLTVANLIANVDVDPNTLNLGSNGNFITAYIELPAGHDVNNILVPEVTLNGVPNAPHPPSVGDQDLDGVPDLMVKFPRNLVSEVLDEGDNVKITVFGDLTTGDRFLAIDHIRVTSHHVTAPAANVVLPGGATYVVRWDVPNGWHPDHAELSYTLDGGISWNPIASGIQGASYTWSVPDITAPEARVRVALYDGDGLIAYDANDGVFQIRPAVTGVGGDSPSPTRVSFSQNVPNPFRSGSSTVFAYDLPVAGPVSISVYSVTGQLLRVLEERTVPAGRHSVTWDGRDKTGRRVSAGIYFVQMKAGAVKVAKTVTMLN